jgi:hypothetical protein
MHASAQWCQSPRRGSEGACQRARKYARSPTIVAKFTLGAEHEGIELHVVAGQDWSPRAHMNPTAPETKCALRRLRYQDEHMRFNLVLKWHARLFRHHGRYAVQKLGRAPCLLRCAMDFYRFDFLVVFFEDFLAAFRAGCLRGFFAVARFAVVFFAAGFDFFAATFLGLAFFTALFFAAAFFGAFFLEAVEIAFFAFLAGVTTALPTLVFSALFAIRSAVSMTTLFTMAAAPSMTAFTIWTANGFTGCSGVGGLSCSVFLSSSITVS